MASLIGREYSNSQSKTVFRHLLHVSGKVEITNPTFALEA